MAMRPSIRRELNKARELLRFMLRGQRCYFCHGPLIEPEKVVRDGDGTAEPLALAVTIHHKSGDHSDNSAGNTVLSHFSCHKSHHAKHMVRAGGKFHKQGAAVLVDAPKRRKAA
jgi:hypothetical protein